MKDIQELKNLIE